MYGFLFLLGIAVLYCSFDSSSENNRESDEGLVKIIKSKILEFLENLGIIIFFTVVTVPIVLGIRYDVLPKWTFAIPVFMGTPFILGMMWGVWHNMQNAGHRLTFKDRENTKKIVRRYLENHYTYFPDEKTRIGSYPLLSFYGGNFRLEFHGRYLRIWEPVWAVMKADDPDLQRIQEAVNAVNFQFGPTVIMTKPDKDGIIGFFSRRDLLLLPHAPSNDEILDEAFKSFYLVKKLVFDNILKLQPKQIEAKTLPSQSMNRNKNE